MKYIPCPPTLEQTESSTSEETESEEEVAVPPEVRLRGKRKRRKKKMLDYGRLGSPGYVSQVTQHTTQQQQQNQQHTNIKQIHTHQDGCQCTMEHSFLLQMLEQQQVLTSMLGSVLYGSGRQ